MDVTPKGPWIYVKVDPREEKTPGGLYMPAGNMNERLGNATGRVLAVGSGIETKKGKVVPHEVKPGDRIMFRGFLQEANKPGGFMDKEHCLLHVNDILGIVED